MNRLFFLISWTVFLLSGCGASHYVAREPGGPAFFLRIKEAQSVQFASSLDNYRLHAARRVESDLWKVSVPDAVEIKYFYLVDGKPYLPDCRLKEMDDFGSANCIFSAGL